jgi:diguanylate cyclase (GGDEF)-like protein
MEDLVGAIAELVSLRDRELLEHALVHLVHRFIPGRAGTVRLVRIVGEGADLRCLERAHCDTAQALGHFDPAQTSMASYVGTVSPAKGTDAWTPMSELRLLSDYAVRAQCREQGRTVTGGDGPCHTVLPVGTTHPVSAVLEVESPVALGKDSLRILQGVIRIYQNFESLLDYGEKDALTDLLNRKTFDGAFVKASAALADGKKINGERRRETAEAGYWLAVLDIDHFKRVNDNFGHLIGDEVLLLMARLMRSSFRFHDQLYRFGGEEFVILMRCTDATDAAGALERFRSNVQAHAFPQVGQITVSIGFAALREDDTPGGAFDRADKAVYYAKSHGRNQVCSYQDLVDRGELSESVDDSNDIDFF